MMKFTKIMPSASPLCLSLLCLVLVSLPLLAETITVRALGLGDPELIPERYLKTANGFEHLAMSTRQPGVFIQISTEKSLPLFEKLAIEGQPTTYQLVQELKLPEDAKNVLILAFSSDKEEHYLVIPDNFLQNDSNKWLVVNTSSKSVVLQVGGIDGEKLVIESNENRGWSIDVEPEKGFAVTARTNCDDKTFYSTYWRLREQERSIVIFSQEGNKMKLTRISDHFLHPAEGGS